MLAVSSAIARTHGPGARISRSADPGQSLRWSDPDWAVSRAAGGGVRYVASRSTGTGEVAPRVPEAGRPGDDDPRPDVPRRTAAAIVRRTGNGLAPTYGNMHRGVRRGSLHVREQLPGRQGDVQLSRRVECVQAPGGRIFRCGQGGAVSWRRGSILPVGQRRLIMRRIDGSVPFRGGGFAPLNLPLAGVATLVGLVVLWQAADWLGMISTLFLPAPANIGVALYDLTISGELGKQLSASLERLAVGWLIGTVFGIGIGLAVGLSSWWRSPGMAVVSALFPIPKIALVPLFIIWFGIGESSKIITLAFGVFFPTVITTAGGVDNVPRSLIRMAQSFGLSHAAIVRKIVLPAALPAILSGFRVTTSIAIVLLVAAEMIGADRGIGAFVLSAGNLYDTDNLLAGIVVLSLLGLAVAWVIGLLEPMVLAWR